MRIRAACTIALLVFVPLTGHAAKKKKPLSLEVSRQEGALPLVTLTASNVPLGEIAKRLATQLGTTVDVSEGSRSFRVTTELHRQPLDLTLREIAPRAYVDGVLAGGTGDTTILSIHLRGAGETEPALTELKKSRSEVVMFFGNTEDEAIDPLEGQLEVVYRNERLRVFARQQPLSVVVYKIAETLGIPFELIGESRDLVDVSISDASIEQAMRALHPSVRLYHRKDLATFAMTPVRLVLDGSPPAVAAQP